MESVTELVDNEQENEVTSVVGKRVRCSSSDHECLSDLIDAEHLSKKHSLSDMETASFKDIDRVALLDAGAQYGKVIDRRIRELNVECILLPLETSVSTLKEKGFRAIVISGSPNCVNDCRMPYDPTLFQCGLPILGICYGFQLINKHFGGSVSTKDVREDGQFTIDIETSCPIFSGLDCKQDVLLTHGDSVEQLAEPLQVVGMSSDIIVATQHKGMPIYGLQFHPEVDLTVHGKQMIKNFLYEVAGCTGKFTLDSREESCIKYIQNKVGKCKVLSLVSGGVDSAVCTALLNTALGPDKVVALHIDNGFMRKDESSSVKVSLEDLGLKPYVVNAAVRFFTSATVISTYNEEGVVQQHLTPPLHTVTNPEEKRKIIGDTFMKVADEAMYNLHLDSSKVFLAQGTLRPDLIESASILASGKAQVIKTHHNDTDLVRELRSLGRVVEPLADFHKDEVRAIGASLGLPKSIINRHPFPGPGLAIRIICQSEPFLHSDFACTNRVLDLFSHLNHAIKTSAPGISELLELLPRKEEDILLRMSESETLSATVLPVRSVGVQGDGRSYSYVAALSSNLTDFEWEDIMVLAKLIPRICHSINRVVWVFGPAVCGPIEDITPTYLTRGVLSILRECDYLANQVLARHGVEDHVSQMPVVLLPVHFDRDLQQRPAVPSCQRSVVIRTIITSDFMTGIPATPGQQIPLDVLSEMVGALSSVSGISRVLYDLTPKPPATTEWE